MKNMIKHLSITMLMAMCIFIVTGINAQAASKEYKKIEYDTDIDKSVSTRIKVGKYYFHYDKSPKFVRFSKKSKDKGKRIKGDPTRIFTNGTYAYYMDYDQTICRVTLSNNKVKKIKKVKSKQSIWLVHVYDNDIFYMDYSYDLPPGDDGDSIIEGYGTLKAYNVKKKKTRTIRKGVYDETIFGNGRYIAFNTGSKGYFYDCKDKKTIKFTSDAYGGYRNYVDSKYIYYISDSGNLVRYKIAKKYSSKNAKVIGPLPNSKDEYFTSRVLGYKNGKMYYEYYETIREEDSIYFNRYLAVIELKTGKVLRTQYLDQL